MIKIKILTASIFVLLFFCNGQLIGQSSDSKQSKWVDSVYKSLSLQEKIAFYKTINIDEEKEKYDFSSELKEHKITINEAIAELKSSQKDVKATIAAESRELEILIEKYGLISYNLYTNKRETLSRVSLLLVINRLIFINRFFIA